jgi:hypothetical protein
MTEMTGLDALLFVQRMVAEKSVVDSLSLN